jgi:predicted Zn-dependent protease
MLPFDQRRLFLSRAMDLLDTAGGSLTPAQWRIKARLHQELNQTGAALAAYRTALEGEPGQADWRFEMASLLASEGETAEAGRELRRVLARQPAHAGARQLLNSLTEPASQPARSD